MAYFTGTNIDGSSIPGISHKPRDPKEGKEYKKAHEDSILNVQQRNALNGVIGMVICAPITHYRDKTGKEKRWPMRYGFKNVNVTSGSGSPAKYLSPMFLGPIYYMDHNKAGFPRVYRSWNIENLWQGSNRSV